jgi:CHAD domain-containing protein
MPYRLLSSDPTLEFAVRRIAGEQLGRALRSLEATGEARAGAIHDVRKRCKKVRGLLRLVRRAFPAWREENAALRDIAGLLGGARDAGVLGPTFDAVVAEHGAALHAGALAELRAALDGGGEAVAGVDLDATFAEARARLAAVRERARSWRLEGEGWGVLGPGLATIYRDARESRKLAARDPSPHNHHEWRKRVKDHWYHTRLLAPIWPEQLEHRAALARELSELLGAHHDTHVLEERLVSRAFGGGEAAAAHGQVGAELAETHAKVTEAVIALARRRGASLEERAHRLGKRLQADKPGCLEARWHAWWRAWRRETEGREALASAPR